MAGAKNGVLDKLLNRGSVVGLRRQVISPSYRLSPDVLVPLFQFGNQRVQITISVISQNLVGIDLKKKLCYLEFLVTRLVFLDNSSRNILSKFSLSK